MKDFDFRLNNFDFIRLLAALQVVFLHTVHHLNIPVNEEFIRLVSLFPGVPIFFLISGFLISASYEKSGSNIKRYFENRMLRIFPALWVCFIVSIVSVFIFYSLEFNVGEFLIWSLAQLSFVQFYNPDFLRDYGVGVLNGSLWTITVELQFYIAIPVLYFIAEFIRSKLTSKNVNIFLMILFFVFLVFLNSLYSYSGNEDRSFLSKIYAVTLLPHLYMFLSGVFVQRNIKIIYPFLKDKVVVWLVLWGGAVFVCERLGFKISGNHISLIPFVFLSALVVSFSYSFNGVLGRILRGKDISYGVYIYHMVFVNIFFEKGYFGSYYYLLLVFLLTVLFASLSWVYVEKPALSFKRYSLLKIPG